MVVHGRVKNGVVVLDEPGRLPEGAEVRVETVSAEAAQREAQDQSLGQKLLKHAGTCGGLPADLSEHHDHYIHGTPKA